MKLRILIPKSYAAEREYVCRYVFERRLGIAVEFAPAEGNGGACRTQIADTEGRSIVVPDSLFAVPEASRLSGSCIPAVRRLTPGSVGERAGISSRDILALFGTATDGQPAARQTADTRIELDFDALGGIFFLLTGMEEVINQQRDEHGRFPDSRALVSRERLVRRPLVDETVAYLAACLDAIWPGLCRPGGFYRVCPSHDLDHPFLYHGLSPFGVAWRVARRVAGDLMLRKSAHAVGETLFQLSEYLKSGPEKDPYFTLDALMNESEARNLTSCFYVIVDANSPMDGRRYVEDPLIHRALQRISARGHRIGLHASYACYRDPVRASNETVMLRRILGELGIHQGRLGVRQHYLRWAGPEHWRIWNDAGMDYDATIGFSDRAGFRCGTSHSFPVFDLASRKSLRIEERPLIVMDVAICPASEGQWRQKEQGTLANIGEIIGACRRYGGEFELLWHNTQMQNRFLSDAYQRILAKACDGDPPLAD